MHSTLRFWLLLAAMVIPATVLIGQQWSLGPRLASLEVHERDSRVRRAVDGFVGDLLEAYHAQNREIHERLIKPIRLVDLLYERVPPSFERLADVRAELGRPPMLFIAEPREGTFALRYYGLDEEDQLLLFSERTLEPIHRAVLTYVHGMVENDAFREQLWANTFYGSSERWPRAVVHFFHAPLYFDDPVRPRAYAGFWESVDFALETFLLPFLQSGRLADRLEEEGLDPAIFQVAIAGRGGVTLYEGPSLDTAHKGSEPRALALANSRRLKPAARGADRPLRRAGATQGVDTVLEVPLSAYGELFKPLTLRLGTIRGLGARAPSLVRRQNMLLLALAVLWFVVAAFMLVRCAARDRWVAQMHRDFVGRVSHELKTPVAVMLNAVETMSNPKLQDPKEQERCLGMLGSHVRALSGLLERMMAVCRLDTGAGRFETGGGASIDLAGHLPESLPKLCESVGLEWSRVKLDVDEGTVARIDKTSLDLILRNLLDNVVKHAGASPESPVEVTASVHGKRVAITVRDHGVGLSAKDRKRIFRRFFRVSDGLRTDTPGHGLGLALVKSLVEAHGGDVSVVSAVGRGSAFRIRLRTS